MVHALPTGTGDAGRVGGPRDPDTQRPIEQRMSQLPNNSRITKEAIGKGAAAFFGGALAIVGGGVSALGTALVIAAAAPGGGLGALLGLIGGKDAAKLGRAIGAFSTALPVLFALCIPVYIATKIAASGEKLLGVASGVDSKSEDAFALQKFAHDFRYETFLTKWVDLVAGIKPKGSDLT